MNRFVKLIICALAVIFIMGCAGASIKPYAGFKPKNVKKYGYELSVTKMERGAILQSIYYGRVTTKRDCIYLDVSVKNIGNKKLAAHGVSFDLITDQGEVVSATTMFRGGFDGPPDERKSSDLYPNTQKSGQMAFVLKKSQNPVRLIFDSIPGEISVDLP